MLLFLARYIFKVIVQLQGQSVSVYFFFFIVMFFSVCKLFISSFAVIARVFLCTVHQNKLFDF